MRNRIATILLFLSWPVCVVHRRWNNEPLRLVRWIILDRSVSQDFRWYWVYNELWVSQTFILLAFLIMRSRTFAIRCMLRALLLVSVIDIVNYWLFFRRQEYLLAAEGMVMVVASYIIFNHDSNRTNEKTA